MAYSMGKFNGAVIDIDYDEKMEVDKLSSLQTLCVKKLLSDVVLIEHDIENIPNVLKSLLMEEALVEGRYSSITLLMKYWPFEILHIPLPLEFKGLNVLRLLTNGQNWKISDSLRATTMVVLNNFFKLIKSQSFKGKLNTIDLSELPLSACGFRKICKEIDEADCYPKESGSLKYTIRAYCNPETPHEVKKLYELMNVRNLGLPRIQLVVTGLNLSCCTISCLRTMPLLDILNPRDLQKLSLEYANSTTEIISKVFQKAKKFHNLRILDLAYCITYSSFYEEFYIALSDLLQELVHITRLSFCACSMSNYLNHILQNINYREVSIAEENTPPTPPPCKKLKTSCLHPDCSHKSYGSLQYLNLSHCLPSREDLLNLANSWHMDSLKHLVIGSRNFKFYFQSLSALLVAVAPALHVLEIMDLYLEQQQIGPFYSLISNMKNLRFLNITGVSFDWEEQLQHLHLLQQLQHLKCFVISPPQAFTSRVENIIQSFDRNIEVIYDKRT